MNAQNINEDLTWLEYLNSVAIEAKRLDYTYSQISFYQKHIKDCWINGVCPEKCVEELF